LLWLKLHLTRIGLFLLAHWIWNSQMIHRSPTGGDRVIEKWTWECSYRLPGLSEFTLYSIYRHCTPPTHFCLLLQQPAWPFRP
jgi:hypothetical protein